MARSHIWLLGILGLGLALRLVEIDGPLIDQQAWRQADTAALARNFAAEGLDLLYPRVDWRGAGPGYAETNFPLFPYAVACLYTVAGEAHEWLGRLLAAVLSTATGFLLYALMLRLYADARVGLLAALIFLITPMNWFFGRAFMPEALMLFLSVGTLLSFARFQDTGRRRDLALAVLVAALCYLVKIPTLYLGVPLLYLVWHRHGAAFLRRPTLWIYAVASVAPAVLWYLHAASLHAQTGLTFGIWGSTGYDKWGHGLLLQTDFYLLLLRRLAHHGLTPFGVGLFALGLWESLRRTAQRGVSGRVADDIPAPHPGPHLLLAWLAGIALYVLLVPEGNRKLHYYQLPLVPVAASLAALPLAALLGSAAATLPGWLAAAAGRQGGRVGRGCVTGLLLCTLAYSSWAVHGYYRPGRNVYQYYAGCLAAGRSVAAKLPAEALLVVGDLDENAGAPDRAQSPTMLYFCNRKGWQITPPEFSGRTLDSLAAAGATHFVSAARFAMGVPAFWQHLLVRGVATPAAYPALTHDHGEYLAQVRAQVGADRHFIIVPLVR